MENSEWIYVYSLFFGAINITYVYVVGVVWVTVGRGLHSFLFCTVFFSTLLKLAVILKMFGLLKTDEFII